MTRYHVRLQPGSFLHYRVVDTTLATTQAVYTVAGALLYAAAVRLAAELNEGASACEGVLHALPKTTGARRLLGRPPGSPGALPPPRQRLTHTPGQGGPA